MKAPVLAVIRTEDEFRCGTVLAGYDIDDYLVNIIDGKDNSESEGFIEGNNT
jgi:hypothetical protein